MDNPGKASLIICCELTSLILNYPEKSGMDQMVKYAIFGDGCASVVLSAQELQPGDGKWIVEGRFVKLPNYDLFSHKFTYYRLQFMPCGRFTKISPNILE